MINKATIIRENRKSIKIIIDENKGLIVVSPKATTLEKINEVLESKRNWIEKNLKKQKEEYLNNKEFITYKKTLLMGKSYLVEFVNTIRKISIGENAIYFPENFNENNEKFIKKAKKWYNDIAKIVLKERLETLSSIKNIPYKSLKIGDFKGKWGSCDNEKNIKLNWRLIMLPPELTDLVILHELSHTIELNHSVKFYNILNKLIPDYKKNRLVLKQHSYLLKLYRN